uniref:Uncharacterized protein n=1 Tax=Kalanchoe fedtschenkoi TaxID=63787 RepID=A0A7N0UBQ8_KALFE
MKKMVTEAHDGGEFWLPPHFLSEEKVKKDVGGGGAVWRNEKDVKLALPRTEFPYEFVFRSVASSPVDSTASGESEEDEFFAELTRRLTMSESRKVSPLDLCPTYEAPKVSQGSPQSILGGIGSWSGRSSRGSQHSPMQGPSPPATPYEASNDTWGLINAAAGQVALLKLNAEDKLQQSLDGQFRAASGPNQDLNYFNSVQNRKAAFYADQMRRQSYIAAVAAAARQAKVAALLCEQQLENLGRSGRTASTRCRVASDLLTQSAWPPVRKIPAGEVPARPNFQTVSFQRKESAGTGVFLPRRYDTAPAAPPRKKLITAPNAHVPSKVVHALNLGFEEMGARPKPHCSAYAASLSQQNYDAIMARRTAFLAQQHRRVVRPDELAQSNLEACLPQEWSY